MKVNLYKSYGVLAHEATPFYSVSTPASDICDQITVSIPNAIGSNSLGEILVEIDGTQYLLGEVLTDWDGAPALAWFDGATTRHQILTQL